MRPRGPELADVVRGVSRAFYDQLSSAKRRVLSAIASCRTAVLGGHVSACDECGHRRISYNSCRDRHCPKCQGNLRAAWLDARLADLLPVPYFHIVFTLPSQLAPLVLQNKRELYHLLFSAATRTLRTIAEDPKHLGARIGGLCVLHTWSQTLLHHPHLHCVIPGGGFHLSSDDWVPSRPGFFLPVRVLSALFRRLFLEGLRSSFDRGRLRFAGDCEPLQAPDRFFQLLHDLRRLKWVVYSKRPFGGPEKVMAYLGRYTHRVAITSSRLIGFDGSAVRFRYRDSARGNRRAVMTLATDEFVRRFLLHLLPRRFVRIRHFGFLANRNKKVKLQLARQSLVRRSSAVPPTPRPLPPTPAPPLCPACGRGHLHLLELISPSPRSLFQRIDSS